MYPSDLMNAQMQVLVMYRIMKHIKRKKKLQYYYEEISFPFCGFLYPQGKLPLILYAYYYSLQQQRYPTVLQNLRISQ